MSHNKSQSIQRRDFGRHNVNKSCIFPRTQPAERTLSSYLTNASPAPQTKNHRANKTAIVAPTADHNAEKYECGMRRYEDLSFEIRHKVTTDLGLIGEKYAGLNKDLHELQRVKARLARRETKLARAGKELEQKKAMLGKVADKWQELCGGTKYAEKLEELAELEDHLIDKEKRIAVKEGALDKEIAANRKKSEEAAQRVAEFDQHLRNLRERAKTREEQLERSNTELSADTKATTEKEQTVERRKRELDAGEKAAKERQRILAREREQVEERLKGMEALRDGFRDKEKKVFESFNEIKSKHFKTFGKNKVLLMKEQELSLAADKLAQSRRETESKAAELGRKRQALEKIQAELAEREELIGNRETAVQTAEESIRMKKEATKKQTEELDERERKVAAKEDSEEQLQIKMLGIEMSAQALKRKQELQMRCIETEKIKLKEKEIKLRLKEEQLGGYKKIQPRRVGNKENQNVNNA